MNGTSEGPQSKAVLSWPNRITLARILLIPAFVVVTLRVGGRAESPYRYAALIVFLVMAVSDAVDGILARWRRERTILGRYLDPLADKFLLTTACVLISCDVWPEPRFPNWVPVIVISRDVVIVVGSVLLFLINGTIRGEPTLLGKATTCLQMTSVLVTMLGNCLPFALLAASWWAAGIFTIASGLQYVYLGTKQVNTAAGES